MQGTLQQQSIEVEDALVVQELFYQNEWTDGFPIVPPTKDKIETMLETVPMLSLIHISEPTRPY